MLYGGGLLHAAAEVTSGIRHILVCSFSPSKAWSCGEQGGAAGALEAPHEARWSEARRRARAALNATASVVWTDLQGAYG